MVAVLSFASLAATNVQPSLAESHPVKDGGYDGSLIVISGTVRNAVSGEAVAYAEVRAWSDGGGEGGMTAYASSDESGHYALELAPGEISLSAWHSDHQPFEETFAAESDTARDISLSPIPPKTSTIRGVVTDSQDGAPVVGAWMSVWRQYAPEPVEPAAEEDAAGTASASRVAPGYDNYDSYESYYAYDGGGAQTDENGNFDLAVYGGAYSVSVWADGYKSAYATARVQEGETATLAIALKKIPPQTVTVKGTVVDDKTGEPVAGAWVSLEDAEWQQYNSGNTDASGDFELLIQPGYTLIWIRGESVRAVVISECPEGADCPAQQQSIAPEEQGSGYYPWVQSRVLQDGSTVDLDVRLVPRPEFTAVVQGWVVDGAAQTGIAGAYVSIRNEDTGDWGWAQTDKDGSYRIKAKPGFHVVYAGAKGYYQNALTAIVGHGETRLDVPLTEGEEGTAPPIYVALDARASAEASGAPSGSVGTAGVAADAPAQQAAENFASSLGATGEPSYAGSGGGLGKYKPSSAGGKGLFTPSLEPLAAVAGVAILAFSARRRR